MSSHHSTPQCGSVRLIRCCLALTLLSAFSLAQSSRETPAEPNKPAQSKPADKPAFDDEPHFSVSGVKDTSALGGHGSDPIVRERNSLAKDTASLGKNDATPPVASPPALQSLRQRAEQQPQNAEVHHMLADAEEMSGDSLSAVGEYQRAAELDAREDYLFDWGSELLLHHAPEPAFEVFTRGHRSAPKSARMLMGLGAAEYMLGDTDQAVREIGAASDLNPGNPGPYLFLGRILDAEAIPADALTEKLRQFVALQPDRADANYYYALALWKRRKDSHEATLAKVKTLLNRAMELDPKYSAAYVQRGIVRAEQGQDENAISDYQKAIAIDPKMEDAHYRLAQVYRRSGQEDKANAEIKIYEELARESEQQAERERHQMQQFVYTLRDPSPAP